MSLCVLAAGKTLTLAAAAFTLSWTHSIEKTRWEEDWTISPEGLQIVEARVKGSAAGMEPPPGAVLDGGWWRYAPPVPPLPELVLAASGSTGAGWTVCGGGGDCLEIGTEAGVPVVLRACRPDGT